MHPQQLVLTDQLVFISADCFVAVTFASFYSEVQSERVQWFALYTLLAATRGNAVYLLRLSDLPLFGIEPARQAVERFLPVSQWSSDAFLSISSAVEQSLFCCDRCHTASAPFPSLMQLARHFAEHFTVDSSGRLRALRDDQRSTVSALSSAATARQVPQIVVSRKPPADYPRCFDVPLQPQPSLSPLGGSRHRLAGIKRSAESGAILWFPTPPLNVQYQRPSQLNHSLDWFLYKQKKQNV